MHCEHVCIVMAQCFIVHAMANARYRLSEVVHRRAAGPEDQPAGPTVNNFAAAAEPALALRTFCRVFGSSIFPPRRARSANVQSLKRL